MTSNPVVDPADVVRHLHEIASGKRAPIGFNRHECAALLSLIRSPDETPVRKGLYIALTNGQWLRSSNNDDAPQMTLTLTEASTLQEWLRIELNRAAATTGEQK